MRRIAIHTGSRADHSPLKYVIQGLGEACTHIQTTGMYGLEGEIRQKLTEAKPDLFACLGDRYETLIAAAVAAEMTVPIVHIHGGEETEGATDNAFRHAITKLAYYHFTAHADHAQRVIRMGESPDRVFTFGAPGVDGLAETPLSREECEAALGMHLNPPVGLFCYHSETLGLRKDPLAIPTDYYRTLIYSGPNLDGNSDNIRSSLKKLATEEPGRRYYRDSYGRHLWLSLMHHADALIGNSSSFCIEGMTLGKEIVMIGDRQKGRWEHAKKIFASDKYAYGEPGKVSPLIVDKLLSLPIPARPRKAFCD